MSCLKKIYVVAAVAAFSFSALAQSSSSNKASGTSTKSSGNAAGTATTPSTGNTTTTTTPIGQENFNNTGVNSYNNNTGANTFNNNTGTSTAPTTPSNKTNQTPGQSLRMTLGGFNSTNSSAVVSAAKSAGATTAQMQGNTLVVTGDSFNMERFRTLLASQAPNVDIQ